MPDLNLVAPTAAAAHGRTDPAQDWGGTLVPAGHTVATGYVEIHQIVCLVGQGSQLHPAEVERAYRRQLALADGQTWPPPTGYWRQDGRFVLTDGRNRFVAALMLGLQYLFVAWLCPPAEAPVRRSGHAAPPAVTGG